MTDAHSPTGKPPPPGISAAELERHAQLLQFVQAKFGSNLEEALLDLGDVVTVVRRERLLDFVRILKLDSELQFNMLLSVTGVDWLDSRPERFEAVYHFLSTVRGHRIRVRVPVPEQEPTVDSLVSLYAGALFMEREAWDMLGITFRAHPDLRRILMYDEFVGHPLRKDYPVQGKQPRIPLRAPEVENTARDMLRPPLVSINKRPVSTGSAATGSAATGSAAGRGLTAGKGPLQHGAES